MHRFAFACFLTISAASGIPLPQVLDPDWQIEPVAVEPAIHTPVGIAVDQAGRLFVVENNTHQVRPDYPGPKSDRIRMFQRTAAGTWEATTFAEGFRHAMCLEFDPRGVLHLTQRDRLLRLEDTNADGVCDRQTELLRWETKGDYPHNGLSGMTFAADGWLYLGSGENLQEPYTAVGAGGTRIHYTPGGANVFRLRPDGSGLEIVATGLWNGFGLECDGAGRVFAVDNDPDACPPNRLLHIVPGGDYGFNMAYGRAGTHPFQCWNGEIPGTMPMVCGVGEAAVDVLDLRRTGLRRPGLHLMVTSWGAHEIEVLQLENNGPSVVPGSRRTVVRGDAGFRPACMAPGPDGSIYITDWGDREYAVHGKGRIWKLSAKSPAVTAPEAAVLPLSAQERANLADHESAASLRQASGTFTPSREPFQLAAQITGLAAAARKNGMDPGPPFTETPGNPQWHAGLTGATEETKLLQLILARRWHEPVAPDWLRERIADASPAVARLAIRLAAEQRAAVLKPGIEAAIRRHAGDRDVFRTGLAALEWLERDGPSGTPGPLDRWLQPWIVDPAQPAAFRAAALGHLSDRRAAVPQLVPLLRDRDPVLAAAAARALGAVATPEVTGALREAALTGPGPVRLEALASLSGRADADLVPLLPLLASSDPALLLQTVRTLRGALGNAAVREAFEAAFVRCSGRQTGPGAAAALAARAPLAMALGKPPAEIRPGTGQQWLEALGSGKGDADEGRRVFFSAAANCAACHAAEGRGAKVGPDLTTVARSSGRGKLLTSLLEPSREIGPLYGMRVFTLRDGSTVAGIPSDKEAGGRVDMILPGGEVRAVPDDEVVRRDDPAVSLMPEGLELGLTVQEVRDLMAYLESRQ